jgi:hypothetical protein
MSAPGIVLKNVRTYADDLKEAVERDNVTVAKMLMAENKKKEQEELIEAEVSPKAPKNLLYIFLGIIFIGGGIATAGYLYLENQKELAAIEAMKKVEVVEVKSGIITTEGYQEIAIDKKYKTEIVEQVRQLQQQLTASSTVESVENVTEVVFTKGQADSKKIVPLNELLTDIESTIPSSLSRVLNPKFLFGFHNVNGQQPMIIINITSYDIAYEGMLAWEETLPDDLGPFFFDEKLSQVVPTATEMPTGTSTETPSTILEQIPDQDAQRKFEDLIVKNKDVRLIKDANGKIDMLYGFIDKDTIAITTSVDTFAEIIERVKSAKLVR